MKRLLPTLLPLLLLTGCASQTVTPADKTAFITISELVAFGYDNPKPPQGQWSKTAYGDGTYEIEYEAETPDEEQKYPLYFDESLSDERTAKDALTYLAGTRGAMNLGLKTQNLTEKALPNQIIYGDGSSLTTLQSGNIVVGNIFSARKKGRTFSLMLVGMAFDNSKDWDDFAGKKVRAWLDGAK
ncbi:hypothetical protein EON83_18670 [bacterium]|nr:MAG: hypothetical protein EON83_18670 [bacterium]